MYKLLSCYSSVIFFSVKKPQKAWLQLHTTEMIIFIQGSREDKPDENCRVLLQSYSDNNFISHFGSSALRCPLISCSSYKQLHETKAMQNVTCYIHQEKIGK